MISEEDEWTEDKLEAASGKYISPRVLALASGRFAVFGQFTNEHGLPLVRICEEQELVEVVRRVTEEAIEQALVQRVTTPMEQHVEVNAEELGI